MSEDEIRRDERRRLADLLEDNALTITRFACSPESVLGTVVLLLRLPGTPEPSLAAMAAASGEGSDDGPTER